MCRKGGKETNLGFHCPCSACAQSLRPRLRLGCDYVGQRGVVCPQPVQSLEEVLGTACALLHPEDLPAGIDVIRIRRSQTTSLVCQ